MLNNSQNRKISLNEVLSKIKIKSCNKTIFNLVLRPFIITSLIVVLYVIITQKFNSSITEDSLFEFLKCFFIYVLVSLGNLFTIDINSISIDTNLDLYNDFISKNENDKCEIINIKFTTEELIERYKSILRLSVSLYELKNVSSSDGYYSEMINPVNDVRAILYSLILLNKKTVEDYMMKDDLDEIKELEEKIAKLAIGKSTL